LNATDSTAAAWVTIGETARLLGCSHPMARKIIARGRLTVRQLEGGRPWILRSDVEAMARASIRPAVPAEPCPA
jgi:hypothetical protein